MAQHEHVVEIVEQQVRDCRIICPECGPSRKKKYERTMSITLTPEGTYYCCHHCGEAGLVKASPFHQKYLDDMPRKAEVRQIPTQLNDSTNKLTTFFAGRGIAIGPNSHHMPPMITGTKWFRKLNAEVEAIGFVYGPMDAPEAIKWRPLEGKTHTQDGAARSFYNLAALPEAPEEIIIVEGEPDVVALASMGVTAISVPNGAPDKPLVNQRSTPDEDNKFAYLWEARELIDGAKRIVLCVDGDGPGDILSDELARRIGRAKCWRVSYPDECKDPTDVIKNLGADEMNEALDNAEPMPLHGVYSAMDYSTEFEELYLKGHGKGASTGMATVDDLFTIADGQLTVVTGIPNSGKSEFVDQLMINLALHEGWKFAVCSFENPPAMHMAKLSEKIVGKPFYEGVTPRMRKEEAEDAAAFIDNHFVFLDSKDGAVSTVESIIDRAKQAVMRLGVRGLVIDPYNYIEMTGEKEHKNISDMLTAIVTFAKAHGIHVFFIAHPKGMIPKHDGTFPVPTGMHISGGPTWFAKADLGLTVHRGDKGVEIHCWKCRLKWVGKQGMVYVDYDVPTGRYFDYKNGMPDTPVSDVTARSHYLDDVDF